MTHIDTIASNVYSTVTLANGGHYGNPVTIASGVSVSYGVSVSSVDGIYAQDSWTIQNYGSIIGANSNGIGIDLNDGGSVTNAHGATIIGHDGIDSNNVGGTAYVDNSGHVYGQVNGVYLGNGGSVTNETTGSIGGGGNGVYLENGGSVTNEHGGRITGGSYGIHAAGADAAIDNLGGVYGNGAGIYLAGGGSVTDESTGSIGGGTYGVKLADGGSVTNVSGGTITGGGIAGIYSEGVSATVDNAGGVYGAIAGVALNAGGSVTNESTGSIGGGQVGVYFANGGSVTNESGGAITGNGGFGIQIIGTSATVENAGTITGVGGAVDLGGSATNLLIVDPGAKFTGTVEANSTGTAANTIELASGASAGTISGLGTQYTGFQTVTIASDAAWIVGGTTAALEGVTVQGFNSHDRLDLTDLSPTGDTVSLDNSTDLLTIKDSGGDVLATIQLDGSVNGDTFKLLPDSGNGTFVEESDYTPCYCRGTLIRTPKGEVAVESLRIGDLVMTADGSVLPIKWIGRRSYHDWLAVGNPEVQPVCFKAGSIADHVPARDLYVSPEHAMFLDGMLIPALHLVNGISILKMEGMEEIEYFHFEFDRHVVIFADGAAAESFVDDDSRMLFHNADEYRRRYPDERRGRFVEFCAPRVEDGYELETIHHRLTARAERLLPDGTATGAPVRQGYLDRATRTVVEGWAFAGIGEAPVRLAILVNGAVVGQTVADHHRADLESAGIGDGHYGFHFDLPHGLSPDIGHRIEVRRESDWSLLRGGRATLKPDSVDVSSMSQAGALDFTQIDSILDTSR